MASRGTGPSLRGVSRATAGNAGTQAYKQVLFDKTIAENELSQANSWLSEQHKVRSSSERWNREKVVSYSLSTATLTPGPGLVAH